MTGDNTIPTRQVQAWSAKTNRRRHSTTGQVPMAALAQENLLPLPQRPAVEHLLGEARMVSRDGFVSWGGASGPDGCGAGAVRRYSLGTDGT